jgi:hypothetical protein
MEEELDECESKGRRSRRMPRFPRFVSKDKSTKQFSNELPSAEADSLASFMHNRVQGNAANEWIPDTIEPTISRGSPHARRRGRVANRLFTLQDMQRVVEEESVVEASGCLDAYEDPSMRPSSIAREGAPLVSNAQLSSAFGHSILFGPPATTIDVLERLKSLSVQECIHAFSTGDGLPDAPDASEVAPSPLPSPPFNENPWRRDKTSSPVIPRPSPIHVPASTPACSENAPMNLSLPPAAHPCYAPSSCWPPLPPTPYPGFVEHELASRAHPGLSGGFYAPVIHSRQYMQSPYAPPSPNMQHAGEQSYVKQWPTL